MGSLLETIHLSPHGHFKEKPMIENGTKVKVHYTGTLDDGTVFDSSENRDALAFTIGAGQVIGGFDAAVKEMEPGTTKNISIPCNEAYGERNESLVLTLNKDQFPENSTPEIGLTLKLSTPHGPLVARITGIDNDGIVVDANHPLAGQNLNFELTLMEAE